MPGRRRPSAEPRAPKAAPWVGRRQLVTPIDGPLAGRWYFAEDWATLVGAAQHTAPSRAAAGVRPADVLRYRLTDELVDHPTEPAVGKAATILAEQPARLATRRR